MKNNSSDYTRRKFISAAASGLVSAGLVSLSPGVVLAKKTEESTENPEADIIYRQLGRTKLKLPIVSMGVGNASSPGIVQASYELGVRHFDTAANYQFGRNEQMIGSVIKQMGVRDSVVIATKVHTPSQRNDLKPEQSKKKLISACEGSLKRLRTDYIDILHLHCVEDPKEISDPAIVETMSLLKDQKKVRFVGVSTHANMAEIINEIARTGFYDVVLTSINFTMADDTTLLNAIKNAAKKGVGIIAMKTMAGGARWPDPDSRRNYSSSTIATASLKWVMRNKNITTCIPGYNNHEHMREDFSVARNIEYTPEEKEFLSDNKVKLSIGFCRQCRLCMASCPKNVDIPSLMRTHMYATQYSNFSLARATIDDIPKQAGLQTCNSCSVCIAQCANSVDISRRIDELKMIYA